MNILTFSTLFPNQEMPHHGVFVAERLSQLLASETLTSTVIAPVPWFPFRARKFGAYGAHARVPAEERFQGCRVLHPRFPAIPKVGMSLAPVLLGAASYLAIRRTLGDLREFDLIDAHYFYPDGVAATLLGQWLDTPVVITGRGTDLNLIPRYRLPRRQIRWAIHQSAGLITVSEALRQHLLKLGASANKVSVLPNGVDLGKFRPLDRDTVRKELGVTRRTLLSVGNLVELKGHHLIIDGLVKMPDTDLIVVGAGPMERQLMDQAHRRGVSGRVRFTGSVDQSELVRFYNAADCLVLCSSREGMPNVLLESLACGTPVVATSVGGTPEVITEPVAGVLMQDRTTASLVSAVNHIFKVYPGREATRAFAEQFSWSGTSQGQLRLFQQIARGAED